MSGGLDFGTHAELERRKGYSDATDCSGQLVVIEQDDAMWMLSCDACRYEVCVPTRLIDPARHQAAAADRRREASGIPLALRGVALPDDETPVSCALRAWANGSSKHHGLVLAGEVGVGKTHRAAAAAWERVKLGPLRWYSVPVLFAQLGRGFSDQGRSEALDVLVGTDALVLDDIDKTRPSEYAAEQLFCAIDARVTSNAALIVTTNLALSELAERFPEPYGEAIVSRLAGYCVSLEIVGADRRLERFAA